MSENIQWVKLSGVTVRKESHDNLIKKISNTLLEKMTKPIGFEEVTEIYRNELLKLAETEEERKLAHVLAEIGYYKQHAYSLLAELELNDRVSSTGGIVDGKPMRIYRRKSETCS